MPTATHDQSDVHETPLRSLYAAFAGTQAGSIDQREPFQSSTRASPLLVSPTATQRFRELHATSSSELSPGLGADCRRHFLPFQRSTRRLSRAWAATLIPTAVQAFAALHETRASAKPRAPGGAAIGWTAHRLPFQCSTTAFSSTLPTAKQDRGDGHDAPRS